MLVLAPDGRDELISCATSHPDREICGVLGGYYGRDRSRVETIRHTENVATDSRWEYEIGAEELFEAIETIESRDQEVVGFFHSHPSGPTGPSETDAVRATWTDYSYAIVNLGDEPSIGSWRWRGPAKGFEPEELVIESAP